MAYKSSISVNTISKTFTSLGSSLNGARKTIVNISKSVGRSNEERKKSISRDSLLFQRKRENIRRKKQRSLLELSGVGAALKAPSRVIQNTSRSIFGRMLSFAGTILAGWLIYNLPTITGMAQELISRIKRLTTILSSFLPNTGKILNEFKDLFGAYVTNFITFDFFDTSGRVKKEMDELSRAFLDMNGSFEEALKLITTPLTEGVESGQEIPPFGTEYPQGQTPSGGGGGEGTGGEWKPILDVISEAESKRDGYNAIAPGDYHPNLSKMTIAEANKSVGVRNGGKGAIGRYQLTDPINQAATAGLKPTDIFSPANQDKIAIALMEKRGITIEMIKKDPKEASVRLSAIWAGLPLLKPAGRGGVGQSYYEGFNGNHATISTARLEKAFYEVRSYQPPTSRPTPSPSPSPSPTTPRGTLQLIPQTGSGGLIQGSTGKSTGTHFHLDDKEGNYTPQVLANIREVAFRAIKAMQARGSTVFLTNYSQQTPASKNDSILRSQILREQQKHDERSTPGIDIQEQNPNVRSTYPGWPGSATKFPYAVGAVKWRGGYGNEAEIIGSNGVTVSHGAEGSTASQIPQQVSSTRLSSTQVSSVPRPTSTTVAAAPERRGATVIVTAQMQQPQMIASAPQPSSQPQNKPDFPLNNIISNMLLTQLAYT